MNRDKLPLPRMQAMDLALRAHSALNEFRNGSAAAEHWESLTEVLNTVNALMCLGKVFQGVTTEMTKTLYLGLRSAGGSREAVELDVTLVPPLAAVITAYDDCLHVFARKTIAESIRFIDRCTEEQSSMDLDAWCASFEHPPMLTSDDRSRFGSRATSSADQSSRAAKLAA